MKFWLPYTVGSSGSDISIVALRDALRRIGCEAVAEEFPHWLQYAPWLLAWYRPPEGTDIVIGNSWNAFAFRKRGAPLITVERLFVLDPALRPYRSYAQAVFHETLIRACLQRSYRASARVVALSEDTTRSVSRVFPWSHPVLIRNAVDLDFFRPGGSRKPLAGRTRRLLFVGNLSRRKGADMLRPIMDGLGEGYLLEAICGRDDPAVLLGHPRIRAVGRKSLEEIREAYRSADAVLLPTRLEGLPRVAMEALACGTPVVASDASSLPEIVIDGLNGVLCPREDHQAFARAVRDVLACQTRYDEMATAARRFVEAHHDLTRMAEAFRDCAEEVLGRS